MKDSGLQRREFLKKAGLSAMALATSPGLGHSLAIPALAQEGGRIGFMFAALNTAGVIDGVNHQWFMTGNGSFGKNDIEGTGSYIHFDLASPGFPKTLLETGTWRAKRFISWEMSGTPDLIPYGQILSGILKLEARIFPRGGPQRGIDAGMVVI
jgi:hypothetical protein